MNDKTCFFIGSRYSPESIIEQLAEVVEKHITEYGVTTFTVGHYGQFDSMTVSVLKKAKIHHPNIKLYLLATYALNQKREAPEELFIPRG